MTHRKRICKPKEPVGKKELYDFYKKECKELNETALTKSQYLNICSIYNKALFNNILDGRATTIYDRLGKLNIIKFKINPEKLRLDFGHFNKTGEKQFHMNVHSDGFAAKIKWDKNNRNLSGLLQYAFRPTRINREALAAAMRTPNQHKKYFG